MRCAAPARDERAHVQHRTSGGSIVIKIAPAAKKRRGSDDEQKPERRARTGFAREKTQHQHAQNRGEQRRKKTDAEIRVAENVCSGELNQGDFRRLAVIRQLQGVFDQIH